MFWSAWKRTTPGISSDSKKPSQMLREMRILPRLNLTDQAIYELWTEKLPPSLQVFVAMTDDLGLEFLPPQVWDQCVALYSSVFI